MTFKVYFPRDKFKFSSELTILAGNLLKLPKDESHNYNKCGESRYRNLISWCKKNIEYVDNPKDAQISVLPYKFNGMNDPTLLELIRTSNKIWCFYNDDNDKSFSLISKIKLFRTSLKKSRMKKNEFILVPPVTDHFEGYILKRSEPIPTIGFVGQTGYGRKKYLDVLLKSNLKTNFILRNGFWAPGVDKEKAVEEFFQNMKENIFIFCYRGGGNFSYRFYETLMMARIPILVTTDMSLPFEDKINYGEHMVLIPEEKLESPVNIVSWILHFYSRNKDKLDDIQLSNRKLWEDYFSPEGYLSQIIKET